MEWINLQCHVRYFTTSNKNADPQDNELSFDGLQCSRETGVVLTFNESENITVVEQRFALVLLSSVKSSPPKYTIVCLADDVQYFNMFSRERSDGFGVAWHGPVTGVAVYLQAIRRCLQVWDQKWTEVLDNIDNTVKIQVRFFIVLRNSYANSFSNF